MERKIVIECEVCEATGLEESRNTIDGAAFICTSCGGTGKRIFTYKEFKGRKERKGVTRVFKKILKDCCTIIHSGKDAKDSEGKTLHFTRYGCSYDEWKSGAEPLPMEELYCPAEYMGCVDVDNAPCSHCKSGASVGGCNYYWDKAKCWEEWKKSKN